MKTTGLKLAGTGAHIAGLGDDWINPTNITTSDGSLATVTPTGVSDSLRGTNFGFSIPAGSIIRGYLAHILWFKSSPAIQLLAIRIYDGADTNGDSQSNLEIPPTAIPATLSIGNSDNDWGSDPTLSEINNSDFGYQIQVAQTSGTPTVSVDSLKLAIFYAPPTTHRGRFLNRSNLRGRSGR